MPDLPRPLVREESTTEGTGDFTLEPTGGNRRFSTAFGTGSSNDFLYYISNIDTSGDGLEWEFGEGYMSGTNTLVRNVVRRSSNAGSAVDFGPGLKRVVHENNPELVGDPGVTDSLTEETSPQTTDLFVIERPGENTPKKIVEETVRNARTLEGATKNEIVQIASGGDAKVRALGSFVDYVGSNSFTASLVHYSRVFLRSDHTYRWVRHFAQSQISNVTFDVGLYTDTNREPDSLVESSGVVTRDLPNDDFLDIEFSSTFSPSASDWYWIALLNNEGHNTKVTANQINSDVNSLPGFHPALTEARTPSNGLPSTATPSISQIRWPWFATVAQ